MKQKIELAGMFKNIVKKERTSSWNAVTNKYFPKIFVAFIILWHTSEYAFASGNIPQLLEEESTLKNISNCWREQIKQHSQSLQCQSECPLALLPISELRRYICEVSNKLNSCPQVDNEDKESESEHLKLHFKFEDVGCLTLEGKKGDSGAEIFLIKDQKQNCIAALKIFKGNIKCTKSSARLTEIGVLELANSLVALEVNHNELNNIQEGSNSQNFKMVKILGACREEEADNLPLRMSIRSAYAPGEKFYDFLNNTYMRAQEVTEALEIIASSLASFHQSFSFAANGKNTQVYKKYIALEQPKKLYDFIGNNLDELQTLSNDLKCDCSFEEYILGVLQRFKDNNYAKRLELLTLTHGDLHGGNVFYDFTNKIVTLIDYGTMMKTWRERDKGGPVGDPAEDVGRFIASLWTWAAENLRSQLSQDEKFKLILEWEKCFINTYLDKVGKKNFAIFNENINFYKLRYYAFKFPRFPSLEIKKSFVRLWSSDIITSK